MIRNKKVKEKGVSGLNIMVCKHALATVYNTLPSKSQNLRPPAIYSSHLSFSQKYNLKSRQHSCLQACSALKSQRLGHYWVLGSFSFLIFHFYLLFFSAKVECIILFSFALLPLKMVTGVLPVARFLLEGTAPKEPLYFHSLESSHLAPTIISSFCSFRSTPLQTWERPALPNTAPSVSLPPFGATLEGGRCWAAVASGSEAWSLCQGRQSLAEARALGRELCHDSFSAKLWAGQRCSSPGLVSTLGAPRFRWLPRVDQGSPGGQAPSGRAGAASVPSPAAALRSRDGRQRVPCHRAPGAPLRNAAEAARWSCRSAGSFRCYGDDLWPWERLRRPAQPLLRKPRRPEAVAREPLGALAELWDLGAPGAAPEHLAAWALEGRPVPTHRWPPSQGRSPAPAQASGPIWGRTGACGLVPKAWPPGDGLACLGLGLRGALSPLLRQDWYWGDQAQLSPSFLQRSRFQ